MFPERTERMMKARRKKSRKKAPKRRTGQISVSVLFFSGIIINVQVRR
jgi:hypothetical protein